MESAPPCGPPPAPLKLQAAAAARMRAAHASSDVSLQYGAPGVLHGTQSSINLPPPHRAEHYRDNVAALAAQGFDVYAPTLPGYGRAEKPVLPYGQVRRAGCCPMGRWARLASARPPLARWAAGPPCARANRTWLAASRIVQAGCRKHKPWCLTSVCSGSRCATWQGYRPAGCRHGSPAWSPACKMCRPATRRPRIGRLYGSAPTPLLPLCSPAGPVARLFG